MSKKNLQYMFPPIRVYPGPCRLPRPARAVSPGPGQRGAATGRHRLAISQQDKRAGHLAWHEG